MKKSERDRRIELLKHAIALSREARDEGNMPFGAVLADSDGNIIMSAKNREGKTRDRTDHAERVLAGEASEAFDRDVLQSMTLYSSAEPCVMCAGAVYWSGIGRVVYALSEKALGELTGNDPRNPTMDLPCRNVFDACRPIIEVIGPFPELEEEASAPHRGFWNPGV